MRDFALALHKQHDDLAPLAVFCGHDLLNKANLLEGTQDLPRSTYCSRHTYATPRLKEGVDVYSLAEQMGTFVQMIENHYGHVNTIKHAARVLQGMTGWELPQPESHDANAKASKSGRDLGQLS